MRIRFEQTGGIMGRKISLDLDTSELPADEAETLRQVLDDTNFFALPENLVTQLVPDELQYLITVETDDVVHSVRASDTTATSALRALIQILSQQARSRRTK
ncbi:MAG: hypothetical protein AUJ21_03245 [Anaerolineae bacterium CG1_02_58_13]|nr:MAG: hypothetical protein AUJ21_03245 [Anaerolineae bacterium CG1_02_58_13]